MIRRLAFGLASALLLWGCSEADPHAGHAWPSPSPALWQVTTGDGNVGWLFGTVHALPDGVDWQTEAVDEAFSEADLLVVEIADLRNVDASAAAFDQLAYTSGLPPLLQRVSAQERPAVEALLDRAGASERDFAHMESWAASIVLSGAIRVGDTANGVDRTLLATGKRNMALEGFAAQFALFDSLPPEEQADLLASVAREANAPDRLAGLDAWLSGDLAALEALGAEGVLGDPDLRSALMDGRNKAWLDRIVPAFEADLKPFIAVGAAHMLGDEGLPALLAARGWKVERLQ